MADLKSLRKQATGQSLDTASRQVVRVERVTEDTKEEPKAVISETPAMLEAPGTQTPEKPKEEVVADPTPTIPTLTTSTLAFPLLGGNIDIAALIKQAEASESGEEAEEGQKITIYLEPSQAARLEAFADYLQGVIGRDPKMLQLIFRYLMDTIPQEAFDGFAEYVQSKRLARVMELESKHLQKALTQSLQRQRRAMKPKTK